MRLITGVKLDLSQRSIKDLAAITTMIIMVVGTLTICGVCATVVIAGIFRPVRPETAEHVYQLLSNNQGLVGGLIGGAAGGYLMGKSEGKNSDIEVK